MSGRLATAAAWAFVLPALAGYVRVPQGWNLVLPTSQAGLLVLAVLTAVALARGQARLRDLTVVATTGTVLGGLLIAYAAAWPHLRGWAFAEPALHLGTAAVVYCTFAVLYARLFYRPEILADVFWRATLTAVCLALAAYAAYELGGPGWLVHRQYGTPRLQGLLSEPSAWAPFAPALLLLALARRRRAWFALILLATLLTKSPTVLLAVAGSLAAWYVLRRRTPAGRGAMLGAVLGGGVLAGHWLTGVDIGRPLSANLADQFVVRLASGISAVTSGGTVGRNDRFASTQAVVDELSLRDWLWTGIGPGSEGYILGATGMLPNALPVYVLASFGVLGVAVLAVLLVRAVLAARSQATLGIFLAFVVACTINSAGGWEGYKFVVVAIVAGVSGVRAPGRRGRTPSPPLPGAAPDPRTAAGRR